MKIELQKETGVNKTTGQPDTWFWVRAYKGDSNDRVVSECFKDQGEAKTYYDGLILHHGIFKTFEPKIEVIYSKEVNPTI